MSKITSPILLDSTGQETNKILQQISNSLLAANTLIDDESVSPERVWSSQKIIDALTIEATETGTNLVSFDSIGASRLDVKVEVKNAPIQIQGTLNGKEVLDYLVPLNGTYYLGTGLFIMEDGTVTKLADHYIVAAQGANILEISNVESIEVTYRTISKQSGGGMADFDLIHGGSAREEA
jgi:hypothetical protein